MILRKRKRCGWTGGKKKRDKKKAEEKEAEPEGGR